MGIARGYVRVSTRKQEAGVSLDTQRDAMREYAAEHAQTLTLYEDVESGRNVNRPAYLRLLSDLRPGDVVLVWKLDRAGRNAEEALRFRRLIQERGARLISITEPGMQEPLLYGVNAVFHEEFSRALAAKVVPNMERVVTIERRWVTKAPHWYRLDVKPRVGKQRRVFSEGEGRLVPNEDYPGQAQECWEMLLATNSISGTAAAFDLTYTKLARMINSPAYVGDTLWRGILVTGTHPAIVRRETWEAVRTQRLENPFPSPRRTEGPRLLTGYVFRADSQHRMYHRVRNEHTPYARPYYKTADVVPRPPHAAIPADELHEAVITTLKTLDLSPAEVRTLERDARRAVRTDPHAKRRAQLQRQLIELEAERDAATRALLRGAITDAERARARERHDREEVEYRAGLAALPPLPDVEDVQIRSRGRIGIAHLIDELWRQFNGTDAEIARRAMYDIRELLRLYVRRIEVWGAENEGRFGGDQAVWRRDHPPRIHIVWRDSPSNNEES
jgi:DNA invertase Pin-like site-specific DNA recombinase